MSLSLDYLKPSDVKTEVKQHVSVELLSTKEHQALAQKLVTQNLSRDEISNTLQKIAMTPAGIDNPYRSYPVRQTEWQVKATQVLRQGDFSEATLKSLSQQIASSKLGEKPILTQEEKQQISQLNKKVSVAHEHSVKCNREFEHEYVTEGQKHIAKNIVDEKLGYKERAQLVRQLYVEPSGVSPEMRLYVKDNSQVQEMAGEILKSNDVSLDGVMRLSRLVQSKDVGSVLNEKERLEIMKTRSLKIENDFSTTLKVYQDRELRQKNEFAQEFKTEKHDSIAESLKIESWRGLTWKERADVVKQLACEPRGIGKEFCGHNTELLGFQKKARDMLVNKDLSRDSCNELFGLVQKTELGISPTLQQHADKFERFSEKLEPHMQQAATHSQQQEVKQRQVQEISRGQSMSR